MRKLGVAGVVGLLAVGGATTALATATAPTLTVGTKVSSHKAGSRSNPKGVKLSVTIDWQSLGAANQPIVQTFDIKFPKGSQYNGGQLPKCSLATLNNAGPNACPKKSIMGQGTGDAYADTVITHPQITVVNGGSHRVYFFTVLNNPARVQAPVVGKINKTSGKYGYDLQVTVPQVLQVVAGVPIELTHLSVTAGYKGNKWLSTTSCPKGGQWPFSVTTGYNTGGSSTATSSVSCHK